MKILLVSRRDAGQSSYVHSVRSAFRGYVTSTLCSKGATESRTSMASGELIYMHKYNSSIYLYFPFNACIFTQFLSYYDLYDLIIYLSGCICLFKQNYQSINLYILVEGASGHKRARPDSSQFPFVWESGTRSTHTYSPCCRLLWTDSDINQTYGRFIVKSNMF